MKVVYVAGAYRAKTAWEIEKNIRKAETLACEVWKAGAAALCPHANTRGYYQDECPSKVWLGGYLEVLSRCDAMILVEGWQGSEGTKAEVELAKERNIPIFSNISELREWLGFFEAVFPVKVWNTVPNKNNRVYPKDPTKSNVRILAGKIKPLLSVCEEAHKLTDNSKGDRGAAYGHPLDDYTRSTGAFNSLTGFNLKPEHGILFMLCVKMSREQNCPKRDNRVDGAGYWECLDKVHTERERRENERGTEKEV